MHPISFDHFLNQVTEHFFLQSLIVLTSYDEENLTSAYKKSITVHITLHSVNIKPKELSIDQFVSLPLSVANGQQQTPRDDKNLHIPHHHVHTSASGRAESPDHQTNK